MSEYQDVKWYSTYVAMKEAFPLTRYGQGETYQF